MTNGDLRQAIAISREVTDLADREAAALIAVADALEVRLNREDGQRDSTHCDACWKWHWGCAERKVAELLGAAGSDRVA